VAMTLKDRVAIVTGGSQGIGRAICEDFCRCGATVVACARNESRLAAVAEELRGRELAGRLVPRQLDVTDRSQVEAAVEAVMEDHGRLDVLVNNAGITRDGLLLNMEDEQFEEVLTTNLRAAFWMTRIASRHMVRARYGRIINVSSVSGVMGNAGQANYAASKAGLIGLTKSVAKELAKRNITCNCIAPGFIDTEMTGVLSDKIKEQARQIIPLGRMGRAEEVAFAATFLASEQASYITGQVLIVDGGLRM
jgi:3-oxoacyl-[acyl-carrier protein] reductase